MPTPSGCDDPIRRATGLFVHGTPATRGGAIVTGADLVPPQLSDPRAAKALVYLPIGRAHDRYRGGRRPYVPEMMSRWISLVPA
jgi:hypothetical protein